MDNDDKVANFKKNIRYQSSQRVKRKAPKLKREKLEKFTTTVELSFLDYRRLLHNVILRSKVVPPHLRKTVRKNTAPPTRKMLLPIPPSSSSLDQVLINLSSSFLVYY